MEGVDAGVAGVDGLVDVGALHISAKLVFAQIQRDDLLVSEAILHHHDATVVFIVCMLVEGLFLMAVGELGLSDADAEFLLAMLAHKD